MSSSFLVAMSGDRESAGSVESVALVYGVFLRLVGLVYAGACAMLVGQITALAGSRGIQSAQTRIRRIETDFPSSRRFFLFPSYLFFFGRFSPRRFDAALQLLLCIGAIAGLLVALGVGDSRIWMFVCWSIYLSYASMVQLLIYPWDYLLLEVGFVSLFLPPVSGWFLTSLALESAPVPLLTLYFRCLILRLMLGFGKTKFLGASLTEFSYLKGFMINQPLPNVAGWFIHTLPLAVHQLGLFLFFVSEIPVPIGMVLLSGWSRAACGLGTIFLQINIQMSGNFGFFNTLAGILSIVALDGRSLFLEDFAWTDVYAAPMTHLLLGCIFFPLSVGYFIFNSWCTRSFAHWPSINLDPVTSIGNFIRAIEPFHFIHAYGIFFAQSSPDIRWVPIIEGTDEEVSDVDDEAKLKEIKWEPYHYKFMTVSPKGMPPFVAPYHYRFDQSIFYDSIGMTPDTMFTSLSSGNPYDFLGAGGTNLERVAQNLLLDQASDSPIEALFKRNPFPSATRPVKALRISLYLYQATDLKELRETGRYWKVKYSGDQVKGVMTRASLLRAQIAPGNGGTAATSSPVTITSSPTATSTASPASSGGRDAVQAYYRLREASLWHPDHFLWQTKSEVYSAMTRAYDLAASTAAASGTAVSLASVLTVGLADEYPSIWREELYEGFWHTFLPRVRTLHQRTADTIGVARHIPVLKPNSCLTCQLQKAWTAHGSSLAGSSPLLDWSGEMTALRKEITSSESKSEKGTATTTAITHSDLFFYQVLAHRLVLLMTHRVMQTPLFHGPESSESHRQTDAEERETLESEQRHSESTQACAKHRDDVVGRSTIARVPAPSLSQSLGLLPKLTGLRVACPCKHLHLPSFYHLHLYLMHTLLSCGSETQIAACLVEPKEMLRFQPSFALSTGLILPGLFQVDLLRFHASKSRLTRCITFPKQRESGGLLPGFLAVVFDFLPWQFLPPFDAPPALPAAVARPEHANDCWHVGMDNMHEPTVNLE